MKEAVSLLPIVAIAAIFWLLIVRPASRQRKEAVALQSRLAAGDDVMLTSGVFGTIVGFADDQVELEIAPGVVIRVVRAAVASVRRTDVEDTAGEPEAGSTGNDDGEDAVAHDNNNEER